MKISAKRRRSKAEIKEAKRREDLEKTALRNKIQEVADLKKQLADMGDNIGKAATLHDQVQQLVNDGVLKSTPDGGLVEVEDPEERESIQVASGSKRRPMQGPMEIDRRQAQFFGPSQFDDDPSTNFPNQGIN